MLSRRALPVIAAPLAAWLAVACSNSAPDWNTLAAARIRDQVPEAQIQAVDARTLEAVVNGKATRIDSAELQNQCNRGPKFCDQAFDAAVLQLRGIQGK